MKCSHNNGQGKPDAHDFVGKSDQSILRSTSGNNPSGRSGFTPWSEKKLRKPTFILSTATARSGSFLHILSDGDTFTGDIFEVIGYQVIINDETQNDVENYLIGKWLGG